MFCGIIYSSLSIRNAYCFSQKNICNQSENVSEYISMLQKYKNNSLSVRTIFPVPANMHFEGTLESFWTKPHLEINIIYARSVGEIFPPYTLYTRTRGRPFWGGYVCSRGCLSNLMLLIEDSIFNTKYHLQSHVAYWGRNHFGKKLFSHTMGRYFEEELCYGTSFISWFLEWGYRPVGGSFCINDGNDLKEYFVCFSCHHIYNSKLTHFKRAVGKINFRERLIQKTLQQRQHQTKFDKPILTSSWLTRYSL